MSFGILALIGAVALLGPLIALPRRWDQSVVVGELIAGVLLGRSGADVLHSSNSTFTFLADIGFALMMFVAGSHVPMRDASLRSSLRTGVLRVLLVAVAATALGVGVAAWFGTSNAAVYAVLMASSSAALVLPIVGSLQLTGPAVLALTAQVAVADAASIVALPLVIDRAHAGRAALGAVCVIVAAALAFVVLNAGERSGLRLRVHTLSERRGFALELRVELLILFAICAIAVATHVSIMLAGFCCGLATSAIGEPRRLANQLFALTEGFFGPLFMVWLGSSLDLRALGDHPAFIGLGVALGVGAVAAHLVGVLTRQPVPYGMLAAAQLGVPVAAATIGDQLHVLRPGESAAIVLGALVTIGLASLAGALASRNSAGAAAAPGQD